VRLESIAATVRVIPFPSQAMNVGERVYLQHRLPDGPLLEQLKAVRDTIAEQSSPRLTNGFA
jgi:hypothetical protein